LGVIYITEIIRFKLKREYFLFVILFMQTFEKMEGFSFVTLLTGLNMSRPNTGKDDDDENNQFPQLRTVAALEKSLS
jgi:hypothetical protein